MNKKNTDSKNTSTKHQNLEAKKSSEVLDKDSEKNITAIRMKLNDPKYVENAIYRLATIITNKIFCLRGEI